MVDDMVPGLLNREMRRAVRQHSQAPLDEGIRAAHGIGQSYKKMSL